MKCVLVYRCKRIRQQNNILRRLLDMKQMMQTKYLPTLNLRDLCFRRGQLVLLAR